MKHQRKVEFRRLCETLRLHLANVAKYSHQPHSINLSDPEILQHHLDTRFAQLNTSVELELWQEAFRSVEDVHNLLTMAKKAPRPTMMANYYEKLTKIFLMSGNALYHAAAWGRYYAIVTSIGGKSEEELSKLAGQVLVSALAVPVGLQTSDEPEELKGKNARLTALLGLTKMPTRAGLLKDAVSVNMYVGYLCRMLITRSTAFSRCLETFAAICQRIIWHPRGHFQPPDSLLLHRPSLTNPIDFGRPVIWLLPLSASPGITFPSPLPFVPSLFLDQSIQPTFTCRSSP